MTASIEGSPSQVINKSEQPITFWGKYKCTIITGAIIGAVVGIAAVAFPVLMSGIAVVVIAKIGIIVGGALLGSFCGACSAAAMSCVRFSSKLQMTEEEAREIFKACCKKARRNYPFLLEPGSLVQQDRNSIERKIFSQFIYPGRIDVNSNVDEIYNAFSNIQP